jgi:hypothetical protein
MCLKANKFRLTSPDELFNKVQTPPQSSGSGVSKLSSNGFPIYENTQKRDEVFLNNLFKNSTKNTLATLPLAFLETAHADSTNTNGLTAVSNITMASGTLPPSSGNKLLGLPERPVTPARGSDFMKSIKSMTPAQREKILATEILSGSEFIELTKGVSADKREQAILTQIQKGNIP